MQALLPKAGCKPKSSNGTPDGQDKPEEDEEEKGSTAEAKSASSKAATVESAIEYIKAMQQERLQTAQMLKQKDDEMAALKKQLQDAGLGESRTESMRDEVDDHDEAVEAAT